VLAQSQKKRSIAADAESLRDGYHAFEPEDRIRWTNGDAAIPAELFQGVRGPCMLMLYLGGVTRYLDDGEERRVA